MTTTRLNKFLALHLGVSRRAADELIEKGKVAVDGSPAQIGQQVSQSQKITVSHKTLATDTSLVYLALNKPAGYVSSRREQGETPTVYSLLPSELRGLKLVGRLDKDSSGLILLTNDGDFAHRMTHPSFRKQKVYEIEINRPLSEEDFLKITESGVAISDGKPSKFQLVACSKGYVAGEAAAKTPYYLLPTTCYWRVTLAEGRNRQIRRTFEALGYHVVKLHRTAFGPYRLGALKSGKFKETGRK